MAPLLVAAPLVLPLVSRGLWVWRRLMQPPVPLCDVRLRVGMTGSGGLQRKVWRLEEMEVVVVVVEGALAPLLVVWGG